MIRKSGSRFSEKIMLHQKIGAQRLSRFDICLTSRGGDGAAA
jgi:hypothetical protein